MGAIASKISRYIFKEENWSLNQPETTYCGSYIEPIKTGLPQTTKSLCPECSKIIDALKYEEDGKVYMKKKCDKHAEIYCFLMRDYITN